jgi:low affinity Fe/Cu permease
MGSVVREPRRLAALPEAFARYAGSLWTSMLAAGLIVALLITGTITGFPQWWQTFVYTTGALVSLLMLFVIQHTTNRETKAILVKLDELIQSTAGAREEMMGLEEKQIDDQEEIQNQLHRESNGSNSSATS